MHLHFKGNLLFTTQFDSLKKLGIQIRLVLLI